MLLPGFLDSLLFLPDLLLFSLALILASMLHDFVRLETRRSRQAVVGMCRVLPRAAACCRTFGWTSFSSALASSS